MLFATRFGGHDEVTGHDVGEKKTRRNARLSMRPGGESGRSPDSYQSWFGLRFRDERNPGYAPRTVTLYRSRSSSWFNRPDSTGTETVRNLGWHGHKCQGDS
jgi:hypothetical protein